MNYQNNLQQLNKKLESVIDTQSQLQDQLHKLQDQPQTQEPEQNNDESDDDENNKSTECDEIISTDLKELVLNNTISVDL